MPITVRPPQDSDARRLAQINIDAWRSAYDGIVTEGRLDSMDFAAYQERWHRYIHEGVTEGTCFVAELDGLVAAYCMGGAARTDEPDPTITDKTGELYAIYADPALQGKGAGTAVHDRLLEQLALDGYDDAVLWVFEQNRRSQDWYTSRGWIPDGVFGQWMSEGVPVPEIRMRRRL
jgi:ribosomal protein S18 acetylase RimI-like enzyme